MPLHPRSHTRPVPASLLRRGLAILCALILGACAGGTTDPPPPEARGTVTGVVRRAVNAAPVAGARVTIAGVEATTAADGSYSIADIPVGAQTVRCVAAGYRTYETTVNVAAGNNVHAVGLFVQEVFQLAGGNYVMYLPESVEEVRAVLVVLGGPDTRAFADASRSFGTEAVAGPALADALADLRARYQTLAVARGLAILGAAQGTSLAVLSTVLDNAATNAARPSLREAPLVIHGMSAGTFAAAGGAAEFAARTIGLVLRVPVQSMRDQLTSQSGSVPTLVVAAELDAVVFNPPSREAFEGVRASGGLWAYASEPGVGHYDLTLEARALTLLWIETLLDLRLPAVPGGPLRPVGEGDGWLGHPTTFDIAAWNDYAGDRGAASWFPSQAGATAWRNLVQ